MDGRPRTKVKLRDWRKLMETAMREFLDNCALEINPEASIDYLNDAVLRFFQEMISKLAPERVIIK